MDSTASIILGVILGAISSFCSSYANVLMKISHIRKMKEFYEQEQGAAKSIEYGAKTLEDETHFSSPVTGMTTDQDNSNDIMMTSVDESKGYGSNNKRSNIDPSLLASSEYQTQAVTNLEREDHVSGTSTTVANGSLVVISSTAAAAGSSPTPPGADMGMVNSDGHTRVEDKVTTGSLPPMGTTTGSVLNSDSDDKTAHNNISMDAELAKAMSKFGDSLWYNEKAPASHSSNCCLWFSVLLLYAGNVLFRFVALALVPLSTIAPTSALTIACNILLARYYFHERMSRAGFIGTFLVVLGCVLAIVVGQKDEKSIPLEQLLKLFSEKMFVYFIIVYSAIFAVSGIYMMYINGTLIRFSIWIGERVPALGKCILTEEEAAAAAANRRASLRVKPSTTQGENSPSDTAKPSDVLLADASPLGDGTAKSQGEPLNVVEAAKGASKPKVVDNTKPKSLLDVLPQHYNLPLVAPGFSLVPYVPPVSETQEADTVSVKQVALNDPSNSNDNALVDGSATSLSLMNSTRIIEQDGNVDRNESRPAINTAAALPEILTFNPPRSSSAESVSNLGLQTAPQELSGIHDAQDQHGVGPTITCPLLSDQVVSPIVVPTPGFEVGAQNTGMSTGGNTAGALTPGHAVGADAGAGAGAGTGATVAGTGGVGIGNAGFTNTAASNLTSTILALPSYMSNVVGGLVEDMARTVVQFDVLGTLEISRSRAMSRAEGPSADAFFVSQRAIQASSPFLGARHFEAKRMGSVDDATAAVEANSAKRRRRRRCQIRQNNTSYDMSQDTRYKSSYVSTSMNQRRARNKSIGEMECDGEDDMCLEDDDVCTTSDGFSSRSQYPERRIEQQKREEHDFMAKTQDYTGEAKYDIGQAPKYQHSEPASLRLPARVPTETNKSVGSSVMFEDEEDEEMEEEDYFGDEIDYELEDDAELEDARNLDIYAANELREKLATKRMRTLTVSQRRLLALSLSYMGSYTAAWMNLTGKAAMAMLKATFSGDNQFNRWEAYFILIGLVVSVVLSLKFMSLMMSHFPALYIVPIYQCLFIIGLILVGVFFFDEFSTLSAQDMIPFILAILICFVGIYFITYSHSAKDEEVEGQHSDSDEEDEDDEEDVEVEGIEDKSKIEKEEEVKENDSTADRNQAPLTAIQENEVLQKPIGLKQVIIHLDA